MVLREKKKTTRHVDRVVFIERKSYVRIESCVRVENPIRYSECGARRIERQVVMTKTRPPHVLNWKKHRARKDVTLKLGFVLFFFFFRNETRLFAPSFNASSKIAVYCKIATVTILFLRYEELF